jgi:anti-anti-sigma factor
MAVSIVNLTQQDDVTIVDFPPDCDLDGNNVESMRPELFALAEDKQRPNIVIDFQNVAFISSQALGMLVTLRLKSARNGSKVVLAGFRESLMDVVRLTQIDALFPVVATRRDALASLACG